MSKEDKQKEKFSIKDLFYNKQYRSIGILVFYAILFTILIIIIRSPENISLTGSSDTVSLDGYELIAEENFGYKYVIILDEEVYSYEGKKYKNKELVTVVKGEESSTYYFDDEFVYINDGTFYDVSLSKPIIIIDFFNVKLLEEVITRSVLTNEDNKYRIDNQSIYDVFNDGNDKINEGDNYITLEYRNSNITKITFDLSNYAKSIGEKYNNVLITLEYSDFNLIDDFVINVSQ